MRSQLRKHRIATFVAITFATSWIPWLALAVRGDVVSPGFSPVYLLGLVGPLVGAVATTWLCEGGRGLRDLGARMARVHVGMRGWASLGGLLAVAAVTYVVVVAYSMFLLAPVPLPNAHAFGQFPGFPITHGVVLAVLLIAINGFGEETGWRGFLLPALERKHSPLTSSLLVAVVWGAWHIPALLINETYRTMPAAMWPIFFVGLACGSLFLTWLYNRGRHSIALVAVWHGLYNLLSGTVAARGALAAAETTVVITIAAILVGRELRAIHRDRRGNHGDHVLAPS